MIRPQQQPQLDTRSLPEFSPPPVFELIEEKPPEEKPPRQKVKPVQWPAWFASKQIGAGE